MMYSRLARAVLVAGLFISACEKDPAAPAQPRGTVAQVEFNGTRPELYIQDMSGMGRQRIHFAGAVDPFPENSPLVPGFEDANLRALGPLHWSTDGARLALVAALAFDQSQVVILDASGNNARVASPNTQIILSDVEWSADGNKIAYAMSTLPHALGVELFITDLQQNRISKVTTGAGWNLFSGELRFSADGTRLYYGRTTGESGGAVPNHTSEVRQIDLASGQVLTASADIAGQINAIARDASWVLLIRNIGIISNGRYNRQLVRRNLITGQETVLVASGDIQFARLLPGDAEVLVAIDVATTSGSNDYSFGTIAVSGGTLRPLGGTGPATTSVAVHPTARTE